MIIYLLKVFVNILIVGLFLYSKLLPYKDKLNPQFAGIFGFFNRIFEPIFNFLKSRIRPYLVGTGLSVDMSQILILIILLLILNILR